MKEVLESYQGCKLVQEDGRLRFYYPDGDEEVVRKLVATSENPDNDTIYYSIGDEMGKNLRIVFKDHVRSAL